METSWKFKKKVLSTFCKKQNKTMINVNSGCLQEKYNLQFLKLGRYSSHICQFNETSFSKHFRTQMLAGFEPLTFRLNACLFVVVVVVLFFEI